MVTQECIEIIKKFEGCRLKAYKAVPTEKYWTIAYGHYGADVSPNMTITQEQAETLLRKDLVKFEKKVDKYDPIYHWTERERASLISFCYNIGNIDGLTAKGTRTRQQIADAMLGYTKSGGKVLNGLVRRRSAERELFLKGGMSCTPIKIDHPTLRRGAQGNAVGELQGLLGLKQDCIFGCLTETAVRLFQKEHGLVEDGVVGKNTWKELLKIGK